MIRQKINIGIKYRSLTLLGFSHMHRKPSGQVTSMVNVQCDCGKVLCVAMYNLKNGNSSSCRCVGAKNLLASITSHGLTNGDTAKLWSSMKQRCIEKRVDHKNYKNYVLRGISVCPEWINDLKAFHDWCMANGFSKTLQLDRRDNDLGYSPDNCRFVDRITNARNKRNNVYLGDKLRIEVFEDLAESPTRKNYATFSSRIRKGKTVEQAIKNL